VDPIVRPMTEGDVDAARNLHYETFADLDRRVGDPVPVLTPERLERQSRRLRHFLTHDPGGAWVAESGGHVVGVSLASVRDGLWGLSLFVVDPAMQGRGIGRRLLDAALAHGAPGSPGVILSSRDPRAIRRYASAGFDLHPQVQASGRISAANMPPCSPRVRAGDTATDQQFLDAVDREVRGAARGPDHAILGAYHPLLVVDDERGRGYAYLMGGTVGTIAATDEITAADLLRSSLVRGSEGDEDLVVEHLTSGQQWAIRVALEAGLSFAVSGPVFWRGMAPPSAYLPSGAYL
jgi:GNAT superfamily N-acetyltransferase